ncbi:MAG: GPI-anchored wall transfer protein 1 [Amphiamblys sp. WSBS2006]|nr:MAG: GPI-anchored wall transfer protein 1 [Amphiamblys sp. WSBS2006]
MNRNALGDKAGGFLDFFLDCCKEKPEGFYRNTEGTPALELLYLTSVPAIIAVLFSSFRKHFAKNTQIKTHRLFEATAFCFFGVLLIHYPSAGIPVAILTLVLLLRTQKDRTDKKEPEKDLYRAVGLVRGTSCFLTCVAIFAVDFPIFPRRYAKTLLYGLSFMDVGVASAVYSMGLSFRKKKIGKDVKQIAVCCLVGGCITAFKEIPGHGEYGRHLNFFWIIAMVKTIVIAIQKALDYPVALTVATFAIHHTLLHHAGLEEYALNDSRNGFFEDNKEGFVSVLGCLFVFVFGVATRRSIEKKHPKRNIVAWLAVFCALLLSALALGYRPCRRTYNTTMALSGSIIGAFHLLVGYVICDRSFEDSFLFSVSANQFLFFLLANIQTGLYGLALGDSLVQDNIAFGLIFLHILSPSALFHLLYSSPRRNTLKPS